MNKSLPSGLLVRVPQHFFDDHAHRALPAPEIVGVTREHYWVRAEDPELEELYEDARLYSEIQAVDGLDILVSSAASTRWAIEAAWRALRRNRMREQRSGRRRDRER